MRKFIIISAIFAIATANVFAQNVAGNEKAKNSFFQYNMTEKISYEIRMGLNFNRLSADLPKTDPQYDEYCGTRPGFNMGLFANLPFLMNIDFQTGLAFSTKGGDWLYCFELPLLVSYHKQIKPNLKWNVKAGPFIDFIIGDSQYDSGEFGIILATGLYYKKLYFGIQYDMGLTDVCRSFYSSYNYSIGSQVNTGIDKGYTRTFSIELGYRF
jgi:hypothetical protein